MAGAEVKDVDIKDYENRKAEKIVVHYDDGSTREFTEGCLMTVTELDNGDTSLKMLPVDMDGTELIFLLYLVASAYIDMGGEL